MTLRQTERRVIALEGGLITLSRLSDDTLDQRITELAHKTGFGPAWEVARLDPVGGTASLMAAIRATL